LVFKKIGLTYIGSGATFLWSFFLLASYTQAESRRPICLKYLETCYILKFALDEIP